MKVDKQLCKKILSKDYPNSDFEVIAWRLIGFDNVIGFNGQHSILKIDFKLCGKNNCLSYFTKSAIDNPLIIEYFKKVRVYEKEYYMLDNVIQELQSQVDDKLTAKCYVNDVSMFAIFEDLSVRGYSSTDFSQAKTWNYVKKTVEKLAVFHSTSLILEERSGESITSRFPKICFESLYNPMETDAGVTLRACLTVFRNFVFEKVDEIPFEDKLAFTEWTANKILLLAKPSDRYRNVINHGDPWVMNYMYKYNSENEIEDVLLVDFQFCRIAPPAFELQLFLSLRYPYDEMILNSSKVLIAYYDQLERTLTKAGFEPSKIITMQTLRESFDYYRCAGVITKGYYTMITDMPQDYLQTINTPEQFVMLMSQGHIELSSKAFENNQTFRNACVRGILGAYKEYLIDIKKH